MLKLDNSLLDELGLGNLPEDQKRSMLQHIYETLELRVGTNLANQMTDAQLDEFEKFIDEGGDANQAQALQWLETNLPNYKQVVNEVFEALKAEVKQMAPQIAAASNVPLSVGSTAGTVPAGGMAPGAAPSFTQPPALGYGQPAAPAYGQPEPAYGQPAPAAPMNGSFGPAGPAPAGPAPSMPADPYAQPAPQSFGPAPAAPQYGAPANGFSQPQPMMPPAPANDFSQPAYGAPAPQPAPAANGMGYQDPMGFAQNGAQQGNGPAAWQPAPAPTQPGGQQGNDFQFPNQQPPAGPGGFTPQQPGQ